jgi:NADPH:quinone reductase-like Zn-dependent oxidoreductase
VTCADIEPRYHDRGVALHLLPRRPRHPRRHRQSRSVGGRLGLPVGAFIHTDADGLNSHVNKGTNIAFRAPGIYGTRAAGADVILDIMGASYLQRNLAALATGGRLAVIGLQGGAKAELDLNALLRKRATIRATTLRARPTDEKGAIVAAVREVVWPLVSAGQVRPVIHACLPLADAAEAHKIMEADTHVGKILLVT